jgi:hypothetical protein
MGIRMSSMRGAVSRENETLLCVIVPIHQMDGQLEHLEQWLNLDTLEKLKVVLVNDIKPEQASPNLEILISKLNHRNFTYAKGDFSSPGLTRNRGLSCISNHLGWISFWDADDVPIIEEFLRMVNSAEEMGKIYALGDFEVRDFLNNELIKIHEMTNEGISQFGRNVGLWRWAFRSEGIRNVEFQRFRMGEDQDFLFDIDPLTSDVYCHNKVVYSYFKGRKGQLTSRPQQVREIVDSYNYILNKLWKDPSNVSKFRLKILQGQLFTNLRHSKWPTKIKVLISIFKALPAIYRYFTKGKQNE